MASYYNITGYQGDYIQLTLNVQDSSGNAINLAGYSIRGQVRASYGSSGILLDLNPVISNPTSGIININIETPVSEDLPIGDHVYDIERYPAGIPTGNSIKIMRGKFSILPEVTR